MDSVIFISQDRGMTMKKKVMLVLCAFSVLQSTLSLMAAELAGYLPIANVPETWNTNDGGWKTGLPSDGRMNYSSASKAIAIKFFQQSLPMSDQRGAICADSASSGGLLVGNFTNSAIDKLCFDVMKTGVLGGKTKVRLAGRDGAFLECDFPVPESTGVWATVEIPLVYGPEWSGAASVEDFKSILSDVSQVNVVVYSRTEAAAAMLYVDNFRLVGPWEKGPTIGDPNMPMPVYWLTAHGLAVSDGQATNDWDKDGFNNYSEYMAGTDPTNSSSLFRIEIAADESGRPVVKWRHVDYRVFTVMAKENLSDTNEFVAVQSRISSQAGGNKWVADDTSSSFKAFKVQVEAQ